MLAQSFEIARRRFKLDPKSEIARIEAERWALRSNQQRTWLEDRLEIALGADVAELIEEIQQNLGDQALCRVRLSTAERCLAKQVLHILQERILKETSLTVFRRNWRALARYAIFDKRFADLSAAVTADYAGDELQAMIQEARVYGLASDRAYRQVLIDKLRDHPAYDQILAGLPEISTND